MTALADRIEQALQWTGFRQLTPAEASAGPFARDAAERRLVRLDAAACTMAFVNTVDRAVDVVRFLEHQGLDVWGFDLNLENHADRTETVIELRFAISDDHGAIITELRWLGYRQQGLCWTRRDDDCVVPALGPAFDGEIFPCLGWVLAPDASSEFGPAEQRSGFSTRVVPPGATAIDDTRGYRFVHDGYRKRGITRLRIIALIAPSTPLARAGEIVAQAQMLARDAAES
ncbi:MAG: hypothetical protein MUC44_11530 [Beijerinckiaceae bacterium]|jgi:hypothetical protein|nr:hypothetical protein [Beijerinckiaceae bacterium]